MTVERIGYAYSLVDYSVQSSYHDSLYVDILEHVGLEHVGLEQPYYVNRDSVVY
jgi:hypothetical protein